MHPKTTHYHFIGIGGIGMSGLAELLVRRGYAVSGSDLTANALTEKLQRLGVTFFQGHAPENLLESEVVVISSAIGLDNPELKAAQARGLQILSRAQMLAMLMAGKTQIAIAGAHGKTTTTSMTASVLRQGGLAPSVVIGGIVDSLGGNAVLGPGDYFVAEADESDGSFLVFNPHVAVVTNVDREHLDHYRDLAHIQEVFAKFIHQVQPGGAVVACYDDPNLRPLLYGVQGRLITYGLKSGGNYRAAHIQVTGGGSSYTLLRQEKKLGQITIPLAGWHYVANSLAAAAVGFALGLDFRDIQAGLAQTGRIKRRFEIKGENQGVTVIDDYGHHPTEIRATLDAMAQAFAGRRLVVAFQPHRFSRTQALLPDFFDIFQQAQLLFLTDIYSAGERVIHGLSGRDLYRGIREAGHTAVQYVGNREELAPELWNYLRRGDVLVTMGAGDIWKTGEEMLRRLASHPLHASGGSRCFAVRSGEVC
ncbi:UDP-N-acetylmuramate--L-alanine ligase [Desulfobacca acetoxidans]|uniref:UDP-N-acetylmuramate--L-alanine ligase n=1 Tax=Desulfobacca acetoxidans (strain ATCC 700848 / DSM 11109 / ASRB2) TaxID=880072 RepID=F2NG69_DESAR|nr:UDP-N-acetylmuramate--L-alanine ligase [Desulfobacca acetoxidans]AEB08482.1 UDP-N-acetylmuramate--L-alanine ligase [Desulfobacca acetoxidans DSM 11109]